ncbi:MAG: hypothetical protein ACOYKJ_06365 [Candidatus Howiella sp.]|jgi:hemerythrin
MSKKYYMALDDYEHNLLIHALNDKCNECIQNGKYTDAVDEILVKIIEAPKRKFKIKNVEG